MLHKKNQSFDAFDHLKDTNIKRLNINKTINNLYVKI